MTPTKDDVVRAMERVRLKADRSNERECKEEVCVGAREQLAKWERIAESDHGAPIETVEALRFQLANVQTLATKAVDEAVELRAECERLRGEVARAERYNASLIPGAMITATEIACFEVERDSARAALAAVTAERDRLRKLFDDAGQGEHNVLALIDFYIDEEEKACRERDALRPVVDAAIAWRDTWRHRLPFGEESKAVALVDAVDVFEGRPPLTTKRSPTMASETKRLTEIELADVEKRYADAKPKRACHVCGAKEFALVGVGMGRETWVCDVANKTRPIDWDHYSKSSREVCSGDEDVISLAAEVRHFRDMHARAAADNAACAEPAASVLPVGTSTADIMPPEIPRSMHVSELGSMGYLFMPQPVAFTDDERDGLNLARELVVKSNQYASSFAKDDADESRMLARHSAALRALDKAIALVGVPRVAAPSIADDELQFQTWPPRQQGGQHVGVSSGVAAYHVRLGLGVICADERSQLKNRERAVALLAALVGGGAG